ncbi:uncharacterized protein [Hyperolius riggenbachi]|uniref:uncharacterized protein n=1 Tax=Hyperolius riggenbachi TaxID=752182 RepID=UPI0035A3516C
MSISMHSINMEDELMLGQDDSDKHVVLPERPRRSIHLSLKARERYEAESEGMFHSLSELWIKTLQHISDIEKTGSNGEQLNNALTRLKKTYENYRKLSEKYSSFLSQVSTEQASKELDDFTTADQQRHVAFMEAKLQLENRIANLIETTSCTSISSRHSKKLSVQATSHRFTRSSKSLQSLSQRSALSIQLVKARAEAEAAKAQSYCFEQESTLKADAARKQAEAARKQAEATRVQAEAQAEATRVQAEAQAEATRVQAEAQAEATRVQAEAQAEATRVQAEATRVQAETEAQLELLQKKREEAAALARLKVFEQAVEEEEGINYPSLKSADDPAKRTLQFVLNQNNGYTPLLTAEVSAPTCSASKQPECISLTHESQFNTVPLKDSAMLSNTTSPREQIYTPCQTSARYNHKEISQPIGTNPMNLITQSFSSSHAPNITQIKPSPGVNASASPFSTSPLEQHKPHTVCSGDAFPRTEIKSEKSEIEEVGKYMIRRELLNSGLTKFDDQPENYRGWRATFKTIIQNLEIEPIGELDLLIKWLGPQSSEQVKRLKSVHCDDPATGLNIVWERLERVYGCSEAIELALFKRLRNFPKLSNKDNHKFQELSDLLLEVERAKADPHLPGLVYLDTAHGVNPIVQKLPPNIQSEWAKKGSKYKQDYKVSFPPFSFFSKFIRDIATVKNDPSFLFFDATVLPSTSLNCDTQGKFKDSRNSVYVKKTGIFSSSQDSDFKPQQVKENDPRYQCPIHNKPHPLRNCRVFKQMPFEERKSFLREHDICYRCCASTDHFAKDCKVPVKCFDCNSDKHITAYHPSSPKEVLQTAQASKTTPSYGGESTEEMTASVSTKCIEVCEEGFHRKSCSKICLVKVYPEGRPQSAVKMYAILDDQSNRSLASPEFFNVFNIQGETWPYTLQTCSGLVKVSGRRAHGFVVASEYGNTEFPLPTLIECDQLPNNREEIPTPEAALYHPHMKHIASYIPPLDDDAKILLLLGRDIPRVHKVRQQCNGPNDAPYAQKLDFGWVIIGDVYLNTFQESYDVFSCKTSIRESECTFHSLKHPFNFQVQESFSLKTSCDVQKQISCKNSSHQDFGDTIFQITRDDNKTVPSIEDKEFINILNNEFFKDETNSWVAPLPFRSPRIRLPNNKKQAISRLTSLKKILKNKPDMNDHFIKAITSDDGKVRKVKVKTARNGSVKTLFRPITETVLLLPSNEDVLSTRSKGTA